VARWVLHLGYGDRTEQAKSYPAGSYVLVPAGAVHIDGSDWDTLIYGAAIGPWSTAYVDAKVVASAGTPSTARTPTVR